MHNLLSKRWEKRAKGDNGFTLIELLVVVVILGVLIAIAIPLYLNYRKGANDASAQSDMRNAINVLEQCNTDGGAYPIGTFTATGSYTIPAANVCTKQLNLSDGTTLIYNGVTGGTSYVAYDSNSKGAGNKFYCYDSKVGGAVKSQAAAPAAPATSCA